MKKSLILALLLALAGAALALTSFSAPSLLSGESGNCPGGGNCTGNCGENCVCPPSTSCQEEENASEENCTLAGSCPLKPKESGCKSRCSI